MISIATQENFCEHETCQSVPFLPNYLSFETIACIFRTTIGSEDHSKLGPALHIEKDISKCSLKLFSHGRTLIVPYCVLWIYM